MAFDRSKRHSTVPTDPEALYRLLAAVNNGPASLWGHQTDLLRDWHTRYRTSSDVALELPTGAGKTLVGGMIAEWLRLSEKRPVAYLCPNRQLAAQVADHLRDYGVEAVLLTGRVNKWDSSDRARFTAAEAVAVSTYNHVFNSNPALIGAETLLLDDAHAGEQPVASAWSIVVGRDEAAFQTVLSVIADALDPLIVKAIRDDSSIRRYQSTVHLASPLVVASKAAQLEAVLNEALVKGSMNAEAGYALTTLSGHLDRCLVYVSFRRILIRPLISPTGTHAAFDGPRRRVYMSATLGAGGELERAFGRGAIDRMPVPRGWDKQGTGRRFFVFPQLTNELAREEDQLGPWLSATIETHGRAAILTPSTHMSTEVLADALPSGYSRLDGHTVEKDMTAFTDRPKAVLDLANRYDGVDLPDESCRLLILAGLPAQADLQERFLYESLGAGAVLQERVRARIAQGAGRATRNTKDHATVVVIGDDLSNFLFQADVLSSLREELQAEIEFGRVQSLGKKLEDIDDNIQLFLDHGSAWREVEDDIVSERERLTRNDPPGTKQFADAAIHEVAAIQAWWDGDLDLALVHASKALEILSARHATKRYSAIWHYLSATWTRLLVRRDGDPSGDLARSANGSIAKAKTAGRGTSWLSHLATEADPIVNADLYDDLDRLAAQNIVILLRNWSPKDNKELAQAKTNLTQTSHGQFEAGLKALGRFAGATETYAAEGAQAAPDASWLFGDQLWVAWEAKSEAQRTSSIPKRYVQEAMGHLRYIADKQRRDAPAGSFTCYATPQTKIDHTAAVACDDNLYYVPSNKPVAILEDIENALVQSRRLSGAMKEASVLSSLKAANCLPSQWLQALTQQPLKHLGDAV